MADIKGIIFDMDGVILDTETICFRTWKIAGNEFHLTDIEKAQHACLGMNKPDTISTLRRLYGNNFEAERFLERTSELFSQIETTEGIQLMPYAEETLSCLVKKYTVALATSTRREKASRQLENAGVKKYFSSLTFGDMVTHSKPEPEIYLMACRSAGLKPEECAAVEDSPNGIRSAYAAGMQCIMIPDKIQPTDEMQKCCTHICRSLKELQTIL